MATDFPASGSAEEIAQAQLVLSQLESLPQRLTEAYEDFSHYQLHHKATPTTWSLAEIALHWADAEHAFGYRLRSALAGENKTLPGFDPDLWVSSQKAGDIPVGLSLERLSVLRKTAVALFRAMEPQTWVRYYVHADRGQETVARIALFMNYHDQRHLVQLGRVGAQIKESPLG